MKDTILEQVKRELINGHAKRGHPFRYFTLATVHGNTPRLRTVVLRKVLSDFTLIIYTDLRSEKIKHIQDNETVSALFYHPKKLMQVRVEGKAEIITDTNKLNVYWSNVSEKSKKDYTTERAPGIAIKNPDHVAYDPEQPYFCVLKIKPVRIEYLQLKRPNHIRVLFTKQDDDFKGDFLVP